MILFFFFKQKTAYEMRISDWSSDVCSSDLRTTILLAGLLLAACHQQQSPPATAAPTPAALAAHSAEFKREVLNPADGVYVAVGYGIANSILVVGDSGVIVDHQDRIRSEEHTSELQSLMSISYADFCLKKKK